MCRMFLKRGVRLKTDQIFLQVKHPQHRSFVATNVGFEAENVFGQQQLGLKLNLSLQNIDLCQAELKRNLN